MQQATFRETVTNGSLIARTIDLPAIPGFAFRVRWVHLTSSRAGLDRGHVSITHTTDPIDPPGSIEMVEDPEIWFHGQASAGGVYVEYPEDLQLDLAGPQGLLIENNSANTIVIRLAILGRQIRVRNLTDWALLKRRTSHEAE